MKGPHCVVGATRGTGLQIVRQLMLAGDPVRVVVRDAAKARQLLGLDLDIREADVTDRLSLHAACFGECRTIFHAVDITGGIAGRGFFKPSSQIRTVTYQGLVNTVDAAREARFDGRIVLLSGMGSELPSTTGRLLNFIKGNLQRNQRDRDAYLRASGLQYCIGRGGILTDEPDGRQDLRITPPVHRLSALTRLSRSDFARALIRAATHPNAAGRTFDIFNETGSPPTDDALDAQLSSLSHP